MLHLCKSVIKTGYNEADDGLCKLKHMSVSSSPKIIFAYHSTRKSIFRSNPIGIHRAKHCAWDVKQIDHGVPSKYLSEWRLFSIDVGQDLRRKDAEGVPRELLW
jgi:hypothetical protein